jgi:hypothetical protein
VVLDVGVLVEVEVVLDTFGSTIPVTSTLCPTWSFNSLSCPDRTYDAFFVDAAEALELGLVPLVPVGAPAAAPLCGGDGLAAAAPSVEPGVAAAVVEEPLVIAFASRNPFSVVPLTADELKFCTQPVTVIVVSAAALADGALALS